MAGLDSDGDYGRQYAATIRQSVPGYDTLLQLGSCALAADRVELVLASRNSRVFSLDADRLAPPLQLFQALFSRLWISRRPA
jgi:hypothetical protein